MINIIDTQDDFIVVYKPEGINVHVENHTMGMVAQLQTQMGESLYLAHRLDKVTSGLVLLARNPQAAAHFGELFASRKIDKTYLAISDKKPKKKQGKVAGDMKKARGGVWKLLHSHEHPAVTRFYSKSIGDGLRLFVVKPLTGKTHQIRVALKSISAPILGDVRYGGSASDRVYLHAAALSFEWSNERFEYAVAPTTGEYFLNQAALYLSEDGLKSLIHHSEQF